MRKDELENAKAKIIQNAVNEVNNGNYSYDLLQIIMVGIMDFEKEEEAIRREVENAQLYQEYSNMFAKMLLKK